MYLSIGGDMAVRDRAVIGIFDLDNTTYSKRTRELLRRAEELGGVVDVSGELPKSFVLTEEFGMERVYLTQFNAAALEKRLSRRPREGFQSCPRFFYHETAIFPGSPRGRRKM